VNPDGGVVNYKYWNENGGGINNWYMGRSYANGVIPTTGSRIILLHRFQITDKGLEE